MLWGVLSDIHGNAVALDAVLDDLQQFDLAGILGLGDYVGECGESARAIELLLGNRATLVRGNREDALIRAWEGEAEIDDRHQFRCIHRAGEQIQAQHADALRQLPLSLELEMGACKVLATHGTVGNLVDRLYPTETQRIDRLLESMDADVFASGHTHMSWQRTRNERLGFNPGSVGLSHDGLPGVASYALLDVRESGCQVAIRKAAVDVGLLEENMVRSGWIEDGGILARLALAEVRTGRKHILPFVQFAYRYAEKATGMKHDAIPNEIWDAAAKAWSAGESLP